MPRAASAEKQRDTRLEQGSVMQSVPPSASCYLSTSGEDRWRAVGTGARLRLGASAGSESVFRRVFTIAGGVCHPYFLTSVIASLLPRRALLLPVAWPSKTSGSEVKNIVDRFLSSLEALVFALSAVRLSVAKAVLSCAEFIGA